MVKRSGTQKYIVINGIPILFFSGKSHVDEANGREVTSGGFCDFYFDEVINRWVASVHGEAASLGVSFDPLDKDLIEMMLNSRNTRGK